jgi:hypothetical protein
MIDGLQLARILIRALILVRVVCFRLLKNRAKTDTEPHRGTPYILYALLTALQCPGV